MAPFIESVLDQVKGDLAEALSVEKIEQICRELNYSWRECVLDPATTVHAFLRQVLAGNTACDHVPHLTGLPVTGEAYCKARSRLPVELFQRLMSEVAEKAMQGDEAAARWCGHRLWTIDGSGCSMPDTAELQQAFGQSGMQKPGCGFPVAHLMTLFHASTGFLLRMPTAPCERMTCLKPSACTTCLSRTTLLSAIVDSAPMPISRCCFWPGFLACFACIRERS